MGLYIDRVKNHFRFNLKELEALSIACLVAAFLFAFDDGAPTFELSHWLGNYFLILILVILVFFIHETAHKLWALSTGYRAEYKLWPYGIVIALIGAFLSQGKFFFLGLGGVWLVEMGLHRLGSFRHGLNLSLSTWAAFAGPLVNLLLALIFKPIYLATNAWAIGMFVKINLWYAVFSMIPVPPLDGSTGFFGARSTFMLLLGIVIGAAIMIWVAQSFWLMLIGTLVIGFLFWILYFMTIEKVEIS